MAAGVKGAEVVLRPFIALGGRATIPFYSFRLVLRYTHGAPQPYVLGVGIALIGDLAIPLHRLGVVLRHAMAVCVHIPDSQWDNWLILALRGAVFLKTECKSIDRLDCASLPRRRAPADNAPSDRRPGR